MKKVLTIVLLFLFVCVVKAETSLDLISSELKYGNYYKIYNTNNISTTVSNDENNLIINYVNNNDSVSCETKFIYYNENSTFIYNGGVCYRNGESDKEINLIDYSSKIDGTWINELIYVIGKLKGYSEEEILEWRKTVDIYSLSIDIDGLEAKKRNDENVEYINNKGEDFSISLDRFKIDVSKLKINKNIKISRKKLGNLDINPAVFVLFMVSILLYVLSRKYRK